MSVARQLLLISIPSVAMGIAIGALSYWYVDGSVEKESAKAELYAAGDALRERKFDIAMIHAQQARCSAPSTYDPLETIGDIYAEQGDELAATKSYEAALRQLELHGDDALLVAEGHLSAQNVTAHIRRKMTK
jgi:Tfp pilus assembly protein PilF